MDKPYNGDDLSYKGKEIGKSEHTIMTCCPMRFDSRYGYVGKIIEYSTKGGSPTKGRMWQQDITTKGGIYPTTIFPTCTLP